MLIKPGDTVKTDFFRRATVLEAIDGRTRNGWRDTVYFLVRITEPEFPAEVRDQYIRMDEIRDFWNGS